MELWELAAREACRDALAQYTHAGDRFRLEEYAGAFTEDGVLEIRGQEPVRGRAAIVERFGGATAAQQAQRTAAEARVAGAPRRIVRHNVTNVRFESLSPTEAVVASYFTVITHIGLDHMGRYRDRLVPVGAEGRWHIAHRFVSTDWRAPDSIFGG
jgi:SnoaL-like domain